MKTTSHTFKRPLQGVAHIDCVHVLSGWKSNTYSRRIVKSLTFVWFALAAVEGIADDEIIGIGSRHSIQSAVLDENREYWIYLPSSYGDDAYGKREYAVVYLLDGETLFHPVSGLIKFMSEGVNRSWQIPELIVVGIVNVDRTRDLSPTHSQMTLTGRESDAFRTSGGGSRFSDFIETELIPKIEADFRTAPHKSIIGHSFGGLSVLSFLIERPRLFQAYISIDAALWWDDQVVLQQAKDWSQTAKDINARVSFSAAGLDVSKGHFDRRPVWDKTFAKLDAILGSQTSLHFDHQFKLYDDEDHGSVPLISIYDGLRYVFREYRLNYTDLYQGPDYIRAHFKRISEALGYTVLPPGKMIEGYASFLITQLNEKDKGIGFLRLNTDNYPQSAHAHETLADAFAASGNTSDAIDSYNKALLLEPDNERISKKAAAAIVHP